MAQQTSYDLPNYLGELFEKSQRPNAVLKLLGHPAGLNQGQIRTIQNQTFAMGVDFALGAAAQPAILEGAAPSSGQFTTNQSTNVTQIFQRSVDLTYSLQARTAAIGGTASVPGGGAGPLVEVGTLEWQIQQTIRQMARDINYSCLNGAFVSPVNNATARKTRGIITAIATNLAANGGTPRNLTKAIVDNALKAWADNNMFNPGDTLYALCSATQMDNLISVFEGATGFNVYATPGSEEAGVSLRTLNTRMATLKVVYEFDMPAGQILFFQPQFCRLVATPIPRKGILFVEPLGKTNAADQAQAYGEFGIDYTNEIKHGLIKDLN